MIRELITKQIFYTRRSLCLLRLIVSTIVLFLLRLFINSIRIIFESEPVILLLLLVQNFI